MPTLGDVRIFCSGREELTQTAAALLISEIVPVTDLDEQYPGLSGLYESERTRELGRLTAIVPDPNTIRRCTPEELDHYLCVIDDYYDPSNPKHIRLYQPDEQHPDIDHLCDPYHPNIFAKTECPPGLLTSTRNEDSDVYEGMHFDTPGFHGSRFGVNNGKAAREILAFTHSPDLLFDRTDGPLPELITATALRKLFRDKDSEARRKVGILHVDMQPRAKYRMITKKIAHDGGTALYQPGEGVPELNLLTKSRGVPLDAPLNGDEHFSTIGFESLYRVQ